jgi:CheY-like chemotaxis protein/transposase
MIVGDRDMQTQATPETFIEQVKQALEHLYDFPYLQRQPLVQELGFSEGKPGETASQYLRRELVMAIEALSPGGGVAFRAPHARSYNLLYLHYVEGMTIQEAAHELGISVRQAYRDLRRGEESVATVLWSRRHKANPEEPRATHLSSVQAEMARLETHPQPTDMWLLIEHAQKAVEQLALQRGITFQVGSPAEPVIVTTDSVIGRQVLVSALSGAIQQMEPGVLDLKLAPGQNQANLSLSYRPTLEMSRVEAIKPMTTQLTGRLGWTIQQIDHSDGRRSISLTMTAGGPLVLVIDDNEGLVELLDRYLTGHHCRVVAATSGREGLQLAQELSPDAIILDVMMPEVDGWEVLQTLRMRAQTAATPIIICSVVNDPELAYSLGVSLFIPKPVSRDNILTALQQLGVV